MLGLDRTSFSRPWVSAPSQRCHSVPTLTRSLEGPPALPLRHTQLLCLAPRAPGQPCVSPARSAVPCLHLTRPAISPQTRPGNAAESEAPGGVAFLVPEPPSLAGPWGTRVPSGLLPPFPRLLFLLSEPFAPVLGLLILFSDLELHPRALLSSLPPSLCLVSSPDTLCPTWGISRGRESLLGRPPILAKCTPCAGPGGRGPAHSPHCRAGHTRQRPCAGVGRVLTARRGEARGRCGGGAPPARGPPGAFHTLSQRPAAGSPSLVQPGPGSRFLTSCSLLLRNRTGQLPHKERRVLSAPRWQVAEGDAPLPGGLWPSRGGCCLSSACCVPVGRRPLMPMAAGPLGSAEPWDAGALDLPGLLHLGLALHLLL